MLKLNKFFIIGMIFLLIFLFCNYFYINYINRLERSYNRFAIEQLLLLHNQDVNASKILLSSYIQNELFSDYDNNNLAIRDDKFSCDEWRNLEPILLQYTNIESEHLSIPEQEIMKKRKEKFNQISQQFNQVCNE